MNHSRAAYRESLMPRIMAAVAPMDCDDWSQDELDAALAALCMAAATLANQTRNAPNTNARERAAAALEIIRGTRSSESP